MREKSEGLNFLFLEVSSLEKRGGEPVKVRRGLKGGCFLRLRETGKDRKKIGLAA